jgi:hypothetical protein
MVFAHLLETSKLIGVDDLNDFTCGKPAATGALHPGLQFHHPINSLKVQLLNEKGDLFWDAKYDMHGLNEISKGQKAVDGHVQVMKPLCNPGKYVLHVQAEHKEPLQIRNIWPPNFKDTSANGDYQQSQPSSTSSSSQRGPGLSPQEIESEISRPPHAIVCNKPAQIPRFNFTIKEPFKGRNSDVWMPVEYKEWLDKKSMDSIIPAAPTLAKSASVPKNIPSLQNETIIPTQFFDTVDSSHELIPPLRKEEIVVPEVTDSKAIALFDEILKPNLTVSELDPKGAASMTKFQSQSPAISDFLRQNYQFFFGKHDHASFHPSVIFKHPVHHCRIKLFELSNRINPFSIDLENFQPEKLVYDAVFDVQGKRIAVDQKPVDGSIQDFPKLNNTLVPGKETKFKLVVDADDLKYRLPKTGDEKDVIDHRFSPIVTNHRKAEFIFGVTRPATDLMLPISVTARGFI